MLNTAPKISALQESLHTLNFTSCKAQKPLQAQPVQACEPVKKEEGRLTTIISHASRPPFKRKVACSTQHNADASASFPNSTQKLMGITSRL